MKFHGGLGDLAGRDMWDSQVYGRSKTLGEKEQNQVNQNHVPRPAPLPETSNETIESESQTIQ